LKLESKVKQSLDSLEKFLDNTEFKGYDPYDALNSKILTSLSLNNKVLRIVFTQSLKRSPINFRPLLFIKNGYNPKGLGLFLSGYLKLYALTRSDNYLAKINNLVEILEGTKSKGYSGYCWGYNFDWQSETMLTPKYTPTIVNTSYIAQAFLDAYEILKDEQYLEIARSTCQFIIRDLKIIRSNGALCFSYTPLCETTIHNANLLGAAHLARVYSITQESELLEFAQKSMKYAVDHQREDGSWFYGERRHDSGFVNYIDSYHTGFVLECIMNYSLSTGDKSVLIPLKKGLRYYMNHFFLEDGTPKYFNNKLYPIDIHCATQAIITLVKLHEIRDVEALLYKIVIWMIDHMQDKKGYFYFRKGRFFYNKIPYIRWSQAWALYSLASYYTYLKTGDRYKDDN
jgi:rhamnogalacturonyl hydrolase YesR